MPETKPSQTAYSECLSANCSGLSWITWPPAPDTASPADSPHLCLRLQSDIPPQEILGQLRVLPRVNSSTQKEQKRVFLFYTYVKKQPSWYIEIRKPTQFGTLTFEEGFRQNFWTHRASFRGRPARSCRPCSSFSAPLCQLEILNHFLTRDPQLCSWYWEPYAKHPSETYCSS